MPTDPESSVDLLQRVQRGDSDALDRLLRRHLAPLRRWARGRLPPWAREATDTEDVVQDALYKALRGLERFQPQSPGALHAYLRAAVKNRIIDLIRAARRHPRGTEVDDGLPASGDDPLTQAIGREARDRYEAALATLREGERTLVQMRLEEDMPYADIAAALGKSSPDAARVAVRRAVLKLAKAMAIHTGGGRVRHAS